MFYFHRYSQNKLFINIAFRIPSDLALGYTQVFFILFLLIG